MKSAKKMAKSTKMSESIAAEVMYKSDLKCCVCKKEGDHIHHLNEKKDDHRFDNLVYLCFPHHNKASIKGGLSRKLSAKTIIKYRDEHYHNVRLMREKERLVFDKPVDELSEERLLTASKNALIILELENIKAEYHAGDWKEKDQAVQKLYKYAEHSNNRIAHEIFGFLSMVASQTRGKMPEAIAISISQQIMCFFPSFDNGRKKEIIQLAKDAVHIGSNITYDSFIHLNNLSTAMWGLSIIKFIYREAKRVKSKAIVDVILKEYEHLETTLKRPERKDLGEAQELLSIFKKDLEDWDLGFPVIPDKLYERVTNDRDSAEREYLKSESDERRQQMEFATAIMDLIRKSKLKK